MPYAKVNKSDRKIVEITPDRPQLQGKDQQQYEIVEVDDSTQVGQQAQPKGQGGGQASSGHGERGQKQGGDR